MPSWDSGSSGSSSSGPSWGSGSSATGGLEGKRKERKNLIEKVGHGLGTAAVSPVLKALEVLDTGRAAVVSGAKEIDDAVPALAHVDQKVLGTKPEKFDKASLSDFLKQTKAHVGFGDYVDTGNKWLDRGVGFAGDVALDPLSYVTVGASEAAGGARISTKEAARQLADHGEKELAEKVLRRGAGSLSKDEAEKIGARLGATIGIGERRVAIPGTEGVAKAINTVTGPVRDAALTSKLGRAVAPKLSAAAEAVPNGSLLNRLEFDDAKSLAKAEASGMSQAHRHELGNLIRKHKGEDIGQIRNAIEGQAPHTAASRELSGFLNRVADDFERVTGRTVPRIENYLPHKLTEEFRDVMAEGGRRGKSAKHFDSVLRREKRIGSQWFGRELETGSIDEMEAIAKDALGNDYKQVFRNNPWELAHAYVVGMEKEAQRTGLTNKLIEGSVGQAQNTRFSEKKIKGASGQVTKLLKGANKDEAKAAKLLANAEKTGATIDTVRGAVPSAAEIQSATGRGARRTAKADALAVQRADLATTAADLKEAAKVPPPTTTLPAAAEPLSREEVGRARDLVKQVAELDQMARKIDEFRSVAESSGDPLRSRPAAARLDEIRAQRGALVAELHSLKAKAASAAPVFDQATVAVNASGQSIAEANASRLTELSALQTKVGQAERQARQEADHYFAEAARLKASRQADLAAIATLEGLVAKDTADAAQKGARALERRAQANAVKLTHVTSDARAMYEDGLRQFAEGKWSEPWVVEAVDAANRLLTPQESGKFVKLFDTVTSRWKAYSLLSPGFHARNFMGGMFNNSLAGMNPRRYFQYATAARQLRRGGFEAIKDEGVRAAFKEMDRLGILEGHNVRDLSDVAGGGAARGLLPKKLVAIDPTSLDNAALRTNARAGKAVERELRGPLFIDTYLKTGGDAERAMEQVMKYHFDYSDLSSFETKYMKRVIPFYTWTRKNFPLQIQSVIERPGRYTRYVHFKRNVEMGVPADEDVPSYYADLLAVRTPFTNNGNRLYLTPDLPFRDVTETLDPNMLISQLNPLIKTPLEARADKQFFTDVPFTNRLTPVPTAWAPIAAILQPFSGKLGLPKVERSNGQWYMTDKDAYKVEQMLPLLGRLRRLAPSEERYQTRALTTWVSFVFGLGGRTLDQASQFGEVNRQVKELQRINRRNQELGR